MSVCLVTGGAGFIGSHLVEALLGRGDRVRVLDNLSSGYLHNLAAVRDEIELIEADIRDSAAVAEAMAGVDFVFHLAALVSVPKSVEQPLATAEINSLGTLHVLEAARRNGVQGVVLSSSCAVYGDEPTLPKTEGMLPQPKSPYAVSKLAAEYYSQVYYDAYGLKTVALRYFNAFGPRQDMSSPYSGVISIFVDRLARGGVPTIYGDGAQTRDFVFVADVVRANLLAAETDGAAGQVFNIASGRQVSINELFDHVARLMAYDARPVYGPPRSGDIVHSYGNAGRAQQQLGWQPQVSLEDGLRQLIAATGA